MANTTIDPGSGNTTRFYDASAVVLPDSDWCWLMWYRANLAVAAARIWDTGGSGTPNAAYARLTHPAAGTGTESDFGFRFITHDGAGAPVIDLERSVNFPTGWALNSDFLLIVQRRSGNCELHVCEKGGTTFSATPVAWTQGALSPGTEFTIGGAAGGTNLLPNPYGEMAFLSGASLSTAEINTLKAGAPITAVAASPARYYKLRESNDPEPDLGTAGADADQNGTGWALANEFFPDASSGGGSADVAWLRG
jgi:hypothetical protein